MKEIELTRGMVALVDDEDYEWLSESYWCTKPDCSTYYAMTMKPKKTTMHRFIAEKYGWDIEDKYVDHINGNGLDNRKENLRPATKAQSSYNKGKYGGDRTSKYKGVYFSEGWRCELRVNGKRYGKRCKSELEAAQHYDMLAKKFHGEFARLNFPEE